MRNTFGHNLPYINKQTSSAHTYLKGMAILESIAFFYNLFYLPIYIFIIPRTLENNLSKSYKSQMYYVLLRDKKGTTAWQ